MSYRRATTSRSVNWDVPRKASGGDKRDIALGLRCRRLLVVG